MKCCDDSDDDDDDDDDDKDDNDDDDKEKWGIIDGWDHVYTTSTTFLYYRNYFGDENSPFPRNIDEFVP